MRRGRFGTDPFTDLLFNALLGFSFLFLVTVMFVNPLAKLGDVTFKAEFIISVIWPEHRPDDVDLWVEDPNGEIVSYLRKNAGWLHLDRDDRGEINDIVVIDGREVVHPINQEIVTVRGIIAGEYVVNLHYYDNPSGQPVTATLKVEKINPSLRIVFVEQVTLEARDVEKTVLRFTLSGDGEVSAIDRTPKTLTPYALEPA